jgi:16S rRNA U1498 N3-methylase RsmE
MERMNEISKEATEQSRSWRSMNIVFVWSVEEVFESNPSSRYYVCDIIPDQYVFPNTKNTQLQSNSVVFVWPEWWRWPLDYVMINKHTHSLMNLWKTVLRMETAAIIAGRRVVNKL